MKYLINQVARILVFIVAFTPWLGFRLSLAAIAQVSNQQVAEVIDANDVQIVFSKSGMPTAMVNQYSAIYVKTVQSQRFAPNIVQLLLATFNKYQRDYQGLGGTPTVDAIATVMADATILMAVIFRYVGIPGLDGAAKKLIDPVTSQSLVANSLLAGETLDDYVVDLFVEIFKVLYQKYQLAGSSSTNGGSSAGGSGSGTSTGGSNSSSGTGAGAGSTATKSGTTTNTGAGQTGATSGSGTGTGAGQTGTSSSGSTGTGTSSNETAHSGFGAFITFYCGLVGSVVVVAILFSLSRNNGAGWAAIANFFDSNNAKLMKLIDTFNQKYSELTEVEFMQMAAADRAAFDQQVATVLNAAAGDTSNTSASIGEQVVDAVNGAQTGAISQVGSNSVNLDNATVYEYLDTLDSASIEEIQANWSSIASQMEKVSVTAPSDEGFELMSTVVLASKETTLTGQLQVFQDAISKYGLTVESFKGYSETIGASVQNSDQALLNAVLSPENGMVFQVLDQAGKPLLLGSAGVNVDGVSTVYKAPSIDTPGSMDGPGVVDPVAEFNKLFAGFPADAGADGLVNAAKIAGVSQEQLINIVSNSRDFTSVLGSNVERAAVGSILKSTDGFDKLSPTELNPDIAITLYANNLSVIDNAESAASGTIDDLVNIRDAVNFGAVLDTDQILYLEVLYSNLIQDSTLASTLKEFEPFISGLEVA